MCGYRQNSPVFVLVLIMVVFAFVIVILIIIIFIIIIIMMRQKFSILHNIESREYHKQNKIPNH